MFQLVSCHVREVKRERGMKLRRSVRIRESGKYLNAEEELRRRLEGPPDDDVCSICFSNFVYPCRAFCAHWYCGGCILKYWEYGPALEPCKCPMCSQKITRLVLDDESMNQDGDIKEKIKEYNHLFRGVCVEETWDKVMKMMKEVADKKKATRAEYLGVIKDVLRLLEDADVSRPVIEGEEAEQSSSKGRKRKRGCATTVAAP